MVYSLFMRIFIFLSLLSMLLPCGARDVYKSISEDGIVIYSDTYKPGAELVSVTEGHNSVKTKSRSNQEAPLTESEKGAEYQDFSVAQPENDATIRSNEGTVTVGLSLSPSLATGHVIHVYVDGSRLDADMTTTQFSLNALNRGTHTLQAKIVDAEGTVQIATESISFHLRKASIN